MVVGVSCLAIVKKIVSGGAVMVNGIEMGVPASKGGKGHYLPILESIKGQMDGMLSYHCKVLIIRIDLHLHDYTSDNEPISNFIRKLRKRVSVKFNQIRMGYIWCREQDKSDSQHYHLALMFDGSKNQHPHHILKLIEEIWCNWDQPKPYFPKNNYYLLNRDEQDLVQYQKAFERLSYLAKVDTKFKKSKPTNDYSSSRLKIKGKAS